MNSILVLFMLVSAIYCQDQINWNNIKSGQNIIVVQSAENFTSSQHYHRIPPNGRIFKGQDVTNIQKFSYQVGLLLDNKLGFQTWCGASLISNNLILTAAHCLFNMDSVKVILGVLDKNNPDIGSQFIDLTKDNFIIHESFIEGQVYNDIGLIQLKEPIEFSDLIRPVDLITKEVETNIDNMIAIVSGWGLTGDHDGASIKLQYTKSKLWPNTTCQEKFQTLPKPMNELNTNAMICANPNEPNGFCEGDSGGPAVVLFHGRRIQVGIVSFIVSNNNSCDFAMVRVYTRLSKYSDWICKHTKICKK